MEWLAAHGAQQQAFGMICCVFTVIAAFMSYMMTLRG